jgi:hypothetical protein
MLEHSGPATSRRDLGLGDPVARLSDWRGGPTQDAWHVKDSSGRDIQPDVWYHKIVIPLISGSVLVYARPATHTSSRRLMPFSHGSEDPAERARPLRLRSAVVLWISRHAGLNATLAGRSSALGTSICAIPTLCQ